VDVSWQGTRCGWAPPRPRSDSVTRPSLTSGLNGPHSKTEVGAARDIDDPSGDDFESFARNGLGRFLNIFVRNLPPRDKVIRFQNRAAESRETRAARITQSQRTIRGPDDGEWRAAGGQLVLDWLPK